MTGGAYLDTTPRVFDIAVNLLKRTDASSRGVRLLGIAVSGFLDDVHVEQLDLFDASVSL